MWEVARRDAMLTWGLLFPGSVVSGISTRDCHNRPTGLELRVNPKSIRTAG